MDGGDDGNFSTENEFEGDDHNEAAAGASAPLPLQPELFPSAPQGGGGGGTNRASKNTRMRQYRVDLTNKFTALRSLVPNATKNTRVSIIKDAIDYINELNRTVTELKAQVEEERTRLKSSWINRKSKDTEVDVRIIDDEVNVKLIQHKGINRLLFVSKALDELQLNLQHVSGGEIGDHCSYDFKYKIREGSIVYAIDVANKLIDAAEGLSQPNVGSSARDPDIGPDPDNR